MESGGVFAVREFITRMGETVLTVLVPSLD
jgi:hypothetical protein